MEGNLTPEVSLILELCLTPDVSLTAELCLTPELCGKTKIKPRMNGNLTSASGQYYHAFLPVLG